MGSASTRCGWKRSTKNPASSTTPSWEIRGLTFVITIVGAALGPLPFGWAAERGGYGPVLLAGAVGCVAVALLNLVMPSPKNTGGEATTVPTTGHAGV